MSDGDPKLPAKPWGKRGEIQKLGSGTDLIPIKKDVGEGLTKRRDTGKPIVLFEPPKVSVDHFRGALLRVGGVFTKKFDLDPEGHIKEELSKDELKTPDLLSCLGAGETRGLEDVSEVLTYKYKPEDLKLATENVKMIYPNITFDIRESPGEWILYTATINMKRE